jgi:hypothetical protein
MLSRVSRLSACALLAAAALGSCPVARADASVAGCKPATRGISGMNAAQAIKTVTANIPRACGFTISGVFQSGAFFPEWPIFATSTYAANGAVHLVYGAYQTADIDFYNVGGAEYVKLSAAPGQNVSNLWPNFGITSKAVINAAGETKWVRLPAPVRQGTASGKKSDPRDSGAALSAAALANEVSQGPEPSAPRPWQLNGTAVVHGIRCTVLVSKPATNGPFPPVWLYVDTATGLPLQIGYYYPSTHSVHVTSFFGNWGHAPAVTAPPASKVVAG